MSPRDDDSEFWDQDPLLNALRAPGTPTELQDQDRYVAAFRSRFSRGSVGRLVGRFGIGATTVVTTIALSGGVAAAAYTNSLPDPVQRIAHDVLGPVGVPAAPRHAQAAEVAPASPVPVSTDAPSPAGQGTSSATSQPQSGTAPGSADQTVSPAAPLSGVPVTAPPSAAATATTGESAEPAPGQDPPPGRRAGALTATAADRKVPFGASTTVSGLLLDDAGDPLSDRLVRLSGRVRGESWARLGSARTDAEGRVLLPTPPLKQNTRFRLTTSKRRTTAVTTVIILPALQVRASSAAETTAITVTTQGGRAGDRVVAYRRQGEVFVKIGSAALGADGAVVWSVPTPRRGFTLVVHLPATRQHGQARAMVRIGRDPARGGEAAAKPPASESAPPGGSSSGPSTGGEVPEVEKSRVSTEGSSS